MDGGLSHRNVPVGSRAVTIAPLQVGWEQMSSSPSALSPQSPQCPGPI